ncbi:MFS transporter [Promethearchaeum syntrophicum]|uniref:MFS transporter n=1 Tax=Promethearchaeum syntrophicum TaxID=2594042 RepID=A0A5B9D8L3_9ARCH|nr:MFS transporter [Candidatus Prometheoarchaeum syntrophicum]QEE15227.1 melibiose:sodium symporter [Candidatus Prometheoarchaeum syntrophicum]
MTETNLKSETSQEPSKKIMASYGTGKFLVEFFSAAFSALVYKYYETNMGLDPLLSTVGFVVYSLWNAINDPLVGHLTIRPTRFAKKWGRRFPWIVGGGFIWVFTLLLIFIVPGSISSNPEGNQIWLLLWMIFTTCTHDTFFSIWELNYQSLFPDKFRGNKIRSWAAGIATVIGVFGIAIGSILPTLIVDYEVDQSYIITALIFTVIGLILFFLMLPGCREEPDMIARYIQEHDVMKKENQKHESFFKQMKEAFKQKNFMAFVLLYFLYQSCTLSMTGSVHYLGDYVLPGEASDTTIIFAGMLVGALISVPLWSFVSKRIQSNQKSLILSAMVIIVSLIAMTFVTSYTGYTITVFSFGLGFGGFWFLITPAMADVIDEIVVKTGKRNDGIYMGFRAFFGRIAFAVQAITFGIVHELTNFINEPNVDQPPEAIIGIRLHLSFFPMIFILIGVIIFWKMNDLNPEKVSEIKKKLEEMNL